MSSQMHYYKKNIGDYAKKAGRLSMLQHGAYTLLLDACYDRERFPTAKEALEWTWAATADEIDAINFILDRFFTLKGNKFVQARIEEELKRYLGSCKTNSGIAQKREEAKRKAKEDKATEEARSVHEACDTVNESPPNQEPLTKNQEPLTNKPIKKKTPTSVEPPDGVSASVWKDFCQLRSTKRAALSATALDAIRREALKAGWTLEDALRESCARGWTGFKASWVNVEATGQWTGKGGTVTTVPSSNKPDPALEKIKADALKAVPMPAAVKAKFNELLQRVGS
jgi:uncharacterized protein YdaU (DUF1376 family)